MALTVAFNGTNITEADSTTGWDNDTITAAEAWTTEVVHQGAACIGFQASNKDGMGFFELATGLNFNTTYAGQHIFMWVNVTMPGTVEALGTTPFSGLYVIAGTDSSNYKKFLVAAKDYKEIMEKGFVRFVFDPSKTATETIGTPDMTDIALFGVWIDTDEAARIDQLFIDRIDVGWGLEITGSSTDFWNDVYAEEISETAGERDNMWGVVQKYSDIFFLYGQIKIGDDSGSGNTVVSDSGKTIKFVSQQYWSGSAWVDLVADDFFKIELVDNTGYTQFTDGIAVGTTAGRAGSTFGGSNLHDTEIDFDTGISHSSSFAKLYATVLNDFRAGITMMDNSASLFYNGSVNRSGQFIAGAAVLRNLIFAETTDVDAALLWNESINIQKCNFIANTLGAAIEMPSATGSPYTFTSLLFSGNTNDVYNSSGSSITINKAGTPVSDPSTSEGSTVNYQASSTLYFLVVDEDANEIAGAYLYINDDDSGAAEFNTTTDVNGEVSESYSGAVSTAILRVRKYGYKPFKETIDISVNVSRTITLIADPQQT